ncbi:TIR domain-containing protein [Gaopeijia maritima]|uniref:TIR domain-containing protein n=1 Tax=Gaopeijia maritima TaxID=3119007 RepID=UPI00324D0E32
MASEKKRRHVFISHHHADDEHVSRLAKLLRGAGYDIRNSSIRAKPANQRRLDRGEVSDETIRRLLRMKISWAGRIVVLVGKDTHKRPWVNWEIEQAHKQGKRIVGVYIRGGTHADVPEAFEKYGSALVGWTSASVMKAIDGETNTFERPDGTSRDPVHEGASLKC